MLSNIIKNHPFKLIAGIMLVGSLVNPAQAASKEEWTHGFIHAKNSKAQASLSVTGSNCDVVEMAFLGVRPIKSLLWGDKIKVNGRSIDFKVTMGFLGRPSNEWANDMVVQSFLGDSDVIVKGALKSHTFTAKGFLEKVTDKIRICEINK